MGGADVGLARAIEADLLPAPRLFYCGHAISQTGGHGDLRAGDRGLCEGGGFCGCGANTLSLVADGPEAVRAAVREELRRGATHIKLMASGGVTSPTDPIEHAQFCDAEISTAVEEAERAGVYVAAHCHPAQATRRAAALGVRTIEHATLIDEPTAQFLAERNVFAVPTLAAIFAMMEDGERYGLPGVSMTKLRRIADRAIEGLAIMHRAGVKMGFGTDLLGPLHLRQGSEFQLRAQALPALEILRSACAINAAILGREGRLGAVREGALADLLVVDGDPLKDISLLSGNGEKLAIVMSRGRFHKRAL
jgi:imidazolonepropionase-like amidohydrolase